MDLTGGLNMYAMVGDEFMSRHNSDESPEGRKVKFLNDGGWDGEAESANGYFDEGEVLTVKEIYVGRSSSTVEFVEFLNKEFNTVMFEDVE